MTPQSTPDRPTTPDDLPPEPTEFEGILYGYNFDALPTRFVACDTGEFWDAAGDVMQPGICVPDCDPTGEACNVDGFC